MHDTACIKHRRDPADRHGVRRENGPAGPVVMWLALFVVLLAAALGTLAGVLWVIGAIVRATFF